MNNGHELIEALNQIEKEKGISKDILLEAMENSLVAACKNEYGKADNIRVNIDRETGEVLNTFDCVEDASNYCITNNYTTAKLSSVMYRIYYTCIGKQSHAYGFKWKYIERCNDYPEME